MARRPPEDVYADLIAAGFSPQAATTMTAIAGGESGWDASALGDLGLQTDKWGPSFGLYQIRTLKSETGKGTYRDIQWLAQSPVNQARAAYAISGGGSNFQPWTVYTSGKWRGFLDTARAAAGGVRDVIATGSDGPFPTFGPDWAPWNWPSNAGNAATARILSGSRNLIIEGLVVALGLVVVGLGVARAVQPTVRRGVDQVNAKRAQVARAVGVGG